MMWVWIFGGIVVFAVVLHGALGYRLYRRWQVLNATLERAAHQARSADDPPHEPDLDEESDRRYLLSEDGRLNVPVN